MEPPPRRWGLGDVAVGLVPTFLNGLAFLAALGADEATDEGTAVTVGALLVSSLLLWSFIVGVPVVATTRKGGGPVRDLGLRFERSDLLALPLGVVLQAVVVPLLYWPLLELLDRTSGDVENEARELVDAASGGGILLLVLVVGVGAPVAEELFYRGLLLRAVEKRWSLAAGVAASTVLFGAAHFQGIQLPALLLFGLVASLLTARAGRLGPAILCHVGFNGWTLFYMLVLDRS